MTYTNNDTHDIIKRLGLIGSMLLISLLAALASIPITWGIVLLFDMDYTRSTLLLSALVPLAVAPGISWYFLKIYFRLQVLERQMNQLATYDFLTGLLTRQSFFERSDRKITHARDHGQSLAVLYLDLDNFKTINDVWGHSAGDKVLAFFGELLRDVFREEDIIGRMGGEEMVVVLEDVPLSTIVQIIERIRKTCRNHQIFIEGELVGFSVSIGVVMHNEPLDDLDAMLMQADKALYYAKKHGKNSEYLFEGDDAYRRLAGDQTGIEVA
jgi:diguanylate cyclase (GGDEF)-like protein